MSRHRPPPRSRVERAASALLRRRTCHIVLRLRREYGHPNLPRRDPLDVLLQTVLSQKTTSDSCRKAFCALQAASGTWEKARTLPVRRIEALIRPAGLSRQKAPRIRAILERIRRDWGRVTLDPLARQSTHDAEEYLLSLPGVGSKTAKCVLLFAWGRPVVPVDTHVGRLARRLGLVAPSLPLARIPDELERLVAPSDRPSFHVNGFLHGRSICRARRPRCEFCVLQSDCAYFQNTGE